MAISIQGWYSSSFPLKAQTFRFCLLVPEAVCLQKFCLHFFFPCLFFFLPMSCSKIHLLHWPPIQDIHVICRNICNITEVAGNRTYYLMHYFQFCPISVWKTCRSQRATLVSWPLNGHDPQFEKHWVCQRGCPPPPLAGSAQWRAESSELLVPAHVPSCLFLLCVSFTTSSQAPCAPKATLQLTFSSCTWTVSAPLESREREHLFFCPNTQLTCPEIDCPGLGSTAAAGAGGSGCKGVILHHWMV